MKPNHACVWIDHREARIFALERTNAEEVVLHDRAATEHIHTKADSVHRGKSGPDFEFFDEVVEALRDYKAVLIVGPGQARNQLAGYIHGKYPSLAKKVWAIEPMDHPTDAQIVAVARKYFEAADRMHG